MNKKELVYQLECLMYSQRRGNQLNLGFVHTIDFNPNYELIVCFSLGITLEQLRSKSRKEEIIAGRKIAFAYVRKHTKLTLQQIATRFEGEIDHATVLHAVRSHNNLIYVGDVKHTEFNELFEFELKKEPTF